jgi:hypothetical protein
MAHSSDRRKKQSSQVASIRRFAGGTRIDDRGSQPEVEGMMKDGLPQFPEFVSAENDLVVYSGN